MLLDFAGLNKHGKTSRRLSLFVNAACILAGGGPEICKLGEGWINFFQGRLYIAQSPGASGIFAARSCQT